MNDGRAITGHITVIEIDEKQKDGNTSWTLDVPMEDMERAIAHAPERLKFLDHPSYNRFRVESRTFDDLIDALIIVAANKALWTDTKWRRKNDQAIALALAKKAASPT